MIRNTQGKFGRNRETNEKLSESANFVIFSYKHHSDLDRVFDMNVVYINEGVWHFVVIQMDIIGTTSAYIEIKAL